MKRLIVSSMLVTATLFPVLSDTNLVPESVSVHAASQTATVNAYNVNIRKGAGTNYSVITKLSKGQKVEITGSKRNSKGETWYSIRFSGKSGWIISSYVSKPFTSTSVKPASKPVVHAPKPVLQTASQSGIINATSLNIRKGPSTSNSVLTYLRKGQKVVIASSTKNSKGEIWYNIKFSGKTGWALSKYVSKITVSPAVKPAPKPVPKPAPKPAIQAPKPAVPVPKPAVPAPKPVVQSPSQSGTINATSLNIRKGPGTNYSGLASLRKGQTVEIISSSKNSKGEVWYNIKFSGKSGWALSKYVTIKAALHTVKPTPAPSQLKYTYAASQTIIYKDKTTQTRLSSPLAENEKLTVIGESSGWVNVQTKTGIRGWVQKSQTSTVLLRRLTNPKISTLEKDTYLDWTKPGNFSFKYSTNGNQLTMKQGFTYVQMPSVKVKGIKEIKTVQVSSTEKSVVITFDPGYTFTLRNYSNKVSLKVIPMGLLGKKIIVDAGHGGKDSGAIGNYLKLKEKDVTLGISLALKKELEKYGAIVTLTRSTDVFLELSERTAIANKSNYDAFVCIHADSFLPKAYGTTTYYNSTLNFNGPKSISLASDVQKNLVGTVHTYDRGTKPQDFYVNRMNELPNILVETAFITNRAEEALLGKDSFRQSTAQGIRKGLETYFRKL